jgi:hypothetical protein
VSVFSGPNQETTVMQRITLVALATCLAAACTPTGAGDVVGQREFSGPPGSGEPNLYAVADGERVILTWLQPASGDHYALRFAVRVGGAWSEPGTIAENDRFFVNWADFPSLIEQADGVWLVHWPEKVADETYAYHVKLAVSSDAGQTWGEPFVPHRDDSPTEHGFVSMVPLEEGGAALVWLDGRQMTGREGAAHGDLDPGEMSLRATTVAADGSLGPDVLLDGRTCECCQTSMVQTLAGLVAVYRDRSEGEIRNIAVVRQVGDEWTEPVHVADDNWMYPGCPVNGPQVSAIDDAAVVAWFTAPEEKGSVKAAFSFDAGASFGGPIRIDDGDPLGRVDVELMADGGAAVVWMERTEGAAEIRIRRVGADGTVTASHVVSETSEARASGFPRIAKTADGVLVAWTEIGEKGGVRVAYIEMEVLDAGW